MISREKTVQLLKVVVKGAWDALPAILVAIPTTAIAGKILVELKKSIDKAKAEGKSDKEAGKATADTAKKLVQESGGVIGFIKELKKEVKENRDVKNPKYINCAIFSVHAEEKLTGEDQERLISVLFEGEETEDGELNHFVELFVNDYFGGDAEACDNAYEVEAEYVAFNFDDSCDHEYSEEDLVLIRDELNKIVGRDVFEDYEGAGTDDSVEY